MRLKNRIIDLLAAEDFWERHAYREDYSTNISDISEIQKEFKKTAESLVAVFKSDLKSLQQDDWIKKDALKRELTKRSEKKGNKIKSAFSKSRLNGK